MCGHWRVHCREFLVFGEALPFGPPQFKGELELVTLLVEALLGDDVGLEERHARAYENAVNGTWPDRIGTGDALALFLGAVRQARAIKGQIGTSFS